jgi:hypothetical protein
MIGRRMLRRSKRKRKKKGGTMYRAPQGVTATAYSLGFSSGLVWLERYQSKVRVKPSSKLTGGS